ncbi:unnamed protein product [Ectocarpus sp. 13 AM-2016]
MAVPVPFVCGVASRLSLVQFAYFQVQSAIASGSEVSPNRSAYYVNSNAAPEPDGNTACLAIFQLEQTLSVWTPVLTRYCRKLDRWQLGLLQPRWPTTYFTQAIGIT